MWLVRVTRFADGRIWYELRETEDDLNALIESVFANHPETHEVSAIQLSDDPLAAPPWTAHQ
jgi:hypothetical protein